MCDDEIGACCSMDLVENHGGGDIQQDQSCPVLNAEDSMIPVDKDRVAQIDGEEIVSLCRQLDTQLDDKARAHNLSAINVKSILHHLIKNPQVISTLMGLSDDATNIPSVKLTRSKTKSSQGEKVELKPVNGPKTFLDVQYENDDDDDDYRPEEIHSQSDDSEDDGDETSHTVNVELEKNGVSSLGNKGTNNGLIEEEDLMSDTLRIDEEEGVITQYQLRSRVKNLNDAAIHDPLADSHNDLFANYQEQEVLTYVESPVYLDFLQGIHASTPIHGNNSMDEDDPEDEEYNVLADLNVDVWDDTEKDRDELRCDKGTEIPLREVEGLFLDLIGTNTIPPELIPLPKKKRKLDSIPKKKNQRTRRRIEIDVENSTNKQNNLYLSPVPASSFIDKPDGSCSLISGIPITFRPEEVQQLKIQLEQHVQLLTQSVVMCFHDRRLFVVKNMYQQMINELDEKYLKYGDYSMFNISNLSASIDSCHDIMNVTPVQSDQITWQRSMTLSGWMPRPEAALVLSRSRALRYPDLIPGVQPEPFDNNHMYFTEGEDLLLALGLIQFRHVPHSTCHNPHGRFYQIHLHNVPGKTPNQIKNHMKVARSRDEYGSDVNPMYKIIMLAEKGLCHIHFPLNSSNVQTESMHSWCDHLKPTWYHRFVMYFTTLDSKTLIPIKRPASPSPIYSSNLSIQQCLNSISEVNLDLQRSGEHASVSAIVHESSVQEDFVSAYFGMNDSDADMEIDVVGCNTPQRMTVLVAKMSSAHNQSRNMDYLSKQNEEGSSDTHSAVDEERQMRNKVEFSGLDRELISTDLNGLEDGEIISEDNLMEDPSISEPKRSTRLRGMVKRQNSVTCDLHNRQKLGNLYREEVLRSKHPSSPIPRSKKDIIRFKMKVSEEKRRELPFKNLHKKRDKARRLETTEDELKGIGGSVRYEENQGSQGNKWSKGGHNAELSGDGTIETSNSVIVDCSNSLRTKTSVEKIINKKLEFLDHQRLVRDKDSKTKNGKSPSLSDEIERETVVTPVLDHQRQLPSQVEIMDGRYTSPDLQENSCLPLTPTLRTPSDFSPDTVYQLSDSKSPLNPPLPMTPRNDEATRSPTLLRSPSSVSRVLFPSEYRHSSNQEYSNTSRENLGLRADNFSLIDLKEPSNTLLETPHKKSDLTSSVESRKYEENLPIIRIDSPIEENSLDSNEPRKRKRTRNEKERMGLEGMLDMNHRNELMSRLARKIADDIKQRMFMHQDAWHAVRRILTSRVELEKKFDQLQYILLPTHHDVLVLLSLLVDEAALSPELLSCPLRRSYIGAIEILIAIEAGFNVKASHRQAYYHGARLRHVTSRSIIKTICNMDETLSGEEFCGRLGNLLSNERPLWNYIKRWLPLAYDEKVSPCDYEFIDLTLTVNTDDDFCSEFIDDMDAVLGTLPNKKGTKLHVSGGQLFSLRNGSYIPVTVLKENKNKKKWVETEAVIEEQLPLNWTKDHDLIILNTYNDMDGDISDILHILVGKLPYSYKEIERRLQFLLSFF